MVHVLNVCGSLQARSSNRAALDVVHAVIRDAGATIDEYDRLARIPPLNPDHVDAPGEFVGDWRARIARADVVIIASPEYAGSLAGVLKNALDWIVGSGELYTKPVGLVTVGTSGGHHARRALVQTLTWQGAHVVASLGIGAPKTKSDADGRVADPETIVALEAFGRSMMDIPTLGARARLDVVGGIVSDAGIDGHRVAPLD